jgi:hypothetical protein
MTNEVEYLLAPRLGSLAVTCFPVTPSISTAEPDPQPPWA